MAWRVNVVGLRGNWKKKSCVLILKVVGERGTVAFAGAHLGGLDEVRLHRRRHAVLGQLCALGAVRAAPCRRGGDVRLPARHSVRHLFLVEICSFFLVSKSLFFLAFPTPPLLHKQRPLRLFLHSWWCVQCASRSAGGGADGASCFVGRYKGGTLFCEEDNFQKLQRVARDEILVGFGFCPSRKSYDHLLHAHRARTRHVFATGPPRRRRLPGGGHGGAVLKLNPDDP